MTERQQKSSKHRSHKSAPGPHYAQDHPIRYIHRLRTPRTHPEKTDKPWSNKTYAKLRHMKHTQIGPHNSHVHSHTHHTHCEPLKNHQDYDIPKHIMQHIQQRHNQNQDNEAHWNESKKSTVPSVIHQRVTHPSQAYKPMAGNS